jgi:amidase
MTELAFRSATALAAAIRAREVGSRELLEHYLKRVERHNPALNAIIVSDLHHARSAPTRSTRHSPAARVGVLCMACR